MESGDSSDEEAPPSNPNRKDLMRKEQSKAVSMLVAMETDHGLRRGAIMFSTQKIGMACCTVYHLWERAKRTCELGIINSPEFISCKRNSGRRVMYPTEFPMSEEWWDVGCSHHSKCLATLILCSL